MISRADELGQAVRFQIFGLLRSKINSSKQLYNGLKRETTKSKGYFLYPFFGDYPENKRSRYILLIMVSSARCKVSKRVDKKGYNQKLD